MDQRNRIKELRLERQMTQAQLAQRTGMNIRTIQKFENGERSLYTTLFSTALKIAEALNVTVYDLLDKRTDEQTRG